jgi:phage N-6-adenine-methyltransferase
LTPPDGTPPAPKRRKMPAQKPATSKQDYGTPWEFIDTVEERFGQLEWDLAASADNCVVRNQEGGRSAQFFSEQENSLGQDWQRVGGLLWLNPPFDNIAKFAKKCVEEANVRTRILLLTPASVDANWYWDFLRPHAIVYALSPRITFVGTEDPYPRGLLLSVFGFSVTAFGRWRWKGKK